MDVIYAHLFSEQDKESIGSLKQQLAKLFEESLRAAFPDISDVPPLVAICNDPKNGDYQWYGLLRLCSKLKAIY